MPECLFVTHVATRRLGEGGATALPEYLAHTAHMVLVVRIEVRCDLRHFTRTIARPHKHFVVCWFLVDVDTVPQQPPAGAHRPEALSEGTYGQSSTHLVCGTRPSKTAVLTDEYCSACITLSPSQVGGARSVSRVSSRIVSYSSCACPVCGVS